MLQPLLRANHYWEPTTIESQPLLRANHYCYNHYWEPKHNQQLVFDIKEIHYFYIEVICDKQSLAYEFDLNQTLLIIL